MKQFIVMVAAIMLGVQLFVMIAGDQEGSVFSMVREVWMMEIDQRNMDEFSGGHP